MAVTYPPWGVVVMGAVMTAAYLVCVADGDLDSSASFIGVVMGTYTVLCAMASANQWESYERQQLLLRTSEVLAATDPLTGCLNRRAFLDRLDRAATGADGGWVVCLVDLDGFKGVNDRSGHAAGDAVLRAVTAALSGVVRETDTVARLGGDEFASWPRRPPARRSRWPPGCGTPSRRWAPTPGSPRASAPPWSGPATRGARCSAAPTRRCTGPRAPAATG
jgi:hypothetical protein